MAKILLVTTVAADEHDLSQELWRAIGDDSNGSRRGAGDGRVQRFQCGESSAYPRDG